jgi:uncharacterized coiled-coil DUF342 family protein/predicted RNA-binding protein with PIN domain
LSKGLLDDQIRTMSYPIEVTTPDLSQQVAAGSDAARGVGAAPDTEMLRPALELAWAVAKAGTQARPPIVPPSRLRPLMSFTSLPDRALATVRQVVEGDADFRARVVAWAEQAQLDGAAWGWLVDPTDSQEEPETSTHGLDVGTPPFVVEKEERSGKGHPADSVGVDAEAGAELALLRQVNELDEHFAVDRQDRRHAEPGRGPINAAHRSTEADRSFSELGRRRAQAQPDSAEAARRIADRERAGLQSAVRALEGRVTSLVADLGDTAEQVTQASEQLDAARDEIALLTDQLEEARAEVARLQAERDATETARGQAEADRDSAEMARQAAEEEVARLQEAVGVLEGRVASLLTDLDDSAEQVSEASQQRDTTRDEVAGLTVQLEEARAEAARLQAERDATEMARGQAEADRQGAEAALGSADEERARLQEAVGVLEGRVASLLTDLDDSAEQVSEASQQRDTTHDEIAGLTELLEEARADAARLQAERDATEMARGQAEADRDSAEMARRDADQERDRLQEAVGVLEGRVASLLTDLDDSAEQVSEASQQRDTTHDEIAGLTELLEEARAETARLQAERDATETARDQAEADRDGAHVARQTASEERTRLQKAVGELEGKVSSLVTDLDDTATQLRQASQQRDTARDEIVMLTEQLHRTSAELARLQAGRDEIRSAAGRGIARAAEAARLLSETLAEVALTRGGPAELQAGTEDASERLAEGPRSGAGELVWSAPDLSDERLARSSRPPGDPAWDEPWLIDDRFGEPQVRPGDRRGRQADERRPGRAWQDEEDRLPHAGWHEQERLSGRSQQRDNYPTNPAQVSNGPVKQPRPPTRRRRPLPLPPAVFYDSFEAADHLVQVPGILLVIDGHNVSSLSSPEVELSRQRHQLVDTLMKLPQGAEPQVQVVFERADLSGWFEPPAPDRCQMRVTFAPDGVPPDQVIRDLIDQLHPAQAVVVATNDRLLQEWVRRCGGNVVSVPQVLAVLNRVSAPAARSGSASRFRRRKS